MFQQKGSHILHTVQRLAHNIICMSLQVVPRLMIVLINPISKKNQKKHCNHIFYCFPKLRTGNSTHADIEVFIFWKRELADAIILLQKTK